MIEKMQYRLISQDVLGRALQDITTRPLDGTQEILIRPYKKDRTLAQNSLMWGWHTEYGKEFGETKDRAHEEFKYYHVRPILLRDDEEGDFARLHDLAMQQPDMMKALVRLLSTTCLSVKQFSEALQEYDMKTARKGYAFVMRGQQYEDAIG